MVNAFHSEPFQVHPSIDPLMEAHESPGTEKQSPGDKSPHREINTTSFMKDRSL